MLQKLLYLLRLKKPPPPPTPAHEDLSATLAARIDSFAQNRIEKGEAMPYYTDDSGRSIGRQVVLAGSMAARVVASVPAEETFPSPAAYLTAVVEALVDARAYHQRSEDDPESFGTGAINSVLEFALQECDRLGIPRPIPNHWE